MLKRLPRPISLMRKGAQACFKPALGARRALRTRKAPSAKPGSPEDRVRSSKRDLPHSKGAFDSFDAFDALLLFETSPQKVSWKFRGQAQSVSERRSRPHFVIISSVAHLRRLLIALSLLSIFLHRVQHFSLRIRIYS